MKNRWRFRTEVQVLREIRKQEVKRRRGKKRAERHIRKLLPPQIISDKLRNLRGIARSRGRQAIVNAVNLIFSKADEIVQMGIDFKPLPGMPGRDVFVRGKMENRKIPELLKEINLFAKKMERPKLVQTQADIHHMIMSKVIAISERREQIEP